MVAVDTPRNELAELDENLVRRQPTALQEADALARRKELYEALHLPTRKGVAGAGALVIILRSQGLSDPGHHGTVVAARALPVIRPGHHPGAARAVDVRAEQPAIASETEAGELGRDVLPGDDRAAQLARVADGAGPRQPGVPVARHGRMAVEGEVERRIGPHALVPGGCPILGRRIAGWPRRAAPVGLLQSRPVDRDRSAAGVRARC